jgi:hypothetical protein
MGRRAERRARLLREEGLAVVDRRTGARPTSATVTDDAVSMILDCYRALGGQMSSPTLAPGPWDLRVEHGLVELDEERHFNRWREITLESTAYDLLGTFPRGLYRVLCGERETECLRAASDRGSWTNPGSERQFGPAGPNGVLTGAGSPRWRQRALYDFMKDLSWFGDFPPVARISIWEELPGCSMLINDAVSRQSIDPNVRSSLVQLIASRWS